MTADRADERASTRPRAIVFAYHDVGVRGLATVLDCGFEVPLVVTHRDKAGETIWFRSVAELAASQGLPCIAPETASDPALLDRCASIGPDFVFSFYYRHLLPASLLAVAARGAYNLHGSLLPKYRGRAPVNWAVLHGERETGATLHAMDAKPDHGAIVDRCAVPILADDTAREVFDKVTVAGEIVLARSLPRLAAGTAVPTAQRLEDGSYFGGRTPEDGRIPPAAGARAIHDLVRAVAPPEYPGAFFTARGRRIGIDATRVTREGGMGDPGAATSFVLRAEGEALAILAVDGGRLAVRRATIDGVARDAASLRRAFGSDDCRPDL